MDSEGISSIVSSSIISISGCILLSVTHDIGLSPVGGDSIRKSPGDLNSVDKIKNFGFTGTKDSSTNYLSRRILSSSFCTKHTTVGFVLSSTKLTRVSSWNDTVWSGVNTNTITLFSGVIWIFTKGYETRGLSISLTTWFRD